MIIPQKFKCCFPIMIRINGKFKTECGEKADKFLELEVGDKQKGAFLCYFHFKEIKKNEDLREKLENYIFRDDEC